MRQRFGQHLTDGIAGENILIEADRQFQEDELAAGVVVEGTNGRRLALRPVIVASPCVEFSRYALKFPEGARPDATVTEALRFLDAGMRGFYATYEGLNGRGGGRSRGASELSETAFDRVTTRRARQGRWTRQAAIPGTRFPPCRPTRR